MRSRDSTCRPRTVRRQDPLCEPLDRRLLMAAGDPDPTFSDDGHVALLFAGAAFDARAVAVRADGMSIIAGSKGGRLAVVRLNVDGSLDLTFGGGGLFESTAMTRANDVALQDDGKIVVVGLEPRVGGGPDPNRFTTVRILADGEGLDTTFDGDGIVSRRYGTDSLGGYCYANAVAIQQDGKIVVGGTAYMDDLFSPGPDFLITRYNSDGSPDATFGTRPAGVPLMWNNAAMGGDDAILGLAIDYNGTPATNPLYGSIVAVGSTNEYWVSGYIPEGSQFAVARFRPNGTLDTGLDGDGKLTTSFSGAQTSWASGVVILPGGKIVVTGSMGPNAGTRNLALARFNSNGSLDSTFGPSGANGKVQQDLFGDDLASDAAPSFLGVGGFLVASSTGVAAFTADGILDTRFSLDGAVPVNAAAGVAVTGADIAPIRRLIVAGAAEAHRYIDVGSVVAIGSFDPNASEAGQDPASITVGRTQRLPYAERIYLNPSGTATPPYRLFADYTVNGMTLVNPLNGPSYIDIPANETTATGFIVPIDDTRVEGDETAIFTISFSNAYDIGTPAEAPTVIRDNDLAGGPTVVESNFLVETAPQRVAFRFTQNVESSIGANDFQVSGATTGNIPFGFQYDPILNTATLSFSGVLPDGDYTARVLSAGVTNASGQPMPADFTFGFFFLKGDANRDGVVNLQDFNRLASNFGQANRTFSQGDFNYDGVVSLQDFNILASRFGTSLAAPAGRGLATFGEANINSDRIADEVLT